VLWLLSCLAQFCLKLLRWIFRVHKNGFLVPIWSTVLNFSVMLSFTFCISLPTFKYSVLRLFTFNPHLRYYSINFCHIFCITFILCCNSVVIRRKKKTYRFVPYWQFNNFSIPFTDIHYNL